MSSLPRTHLEALEAELDIEPGTPSKLEQALEKLGFKLVVEREYENVEGVLSCRICAGELRKSRHEDPTCGHQEGCPNMPCRAVLRHGPGHQSTTNCERLGEHDIHGARVMGQEAQWKGMDGSTGFFDELEEIDE